MPRIPGRDRAMPISWFGVMAAPEAADGAAADAGEPAAGDVLTMFVDEEGLSDGSASTDTTIENDYGSA